MKKTILALGLIVVLSLVGKAEATLSLDGTGLLVCDDVSNLCWNQDAELSGLDDWQAQVDWANNLVLAGFDDFRLAAIDELADLYDQIFAFGGCNVFDCTGTQGPFTNIRSVYWSGTEVDANLAWNFFFALDTQGNFSKGDSGYGWAVHSMPEPVSAVLLGLGLVGLGLTLRRRGKA